MLDLISQIFEVCIIPLIGVLTGFLIKWINKKAAQLSEKTNSEIQQKYLNMLNETITSCVTATTQTYVESLKKQGNFDIEAQKKAFQTTYETVMSLITEEGLEYLNETVNDLSLYVREKIEETVNINKN